MTRNPTRKERRITDLPIMVIGTGEEDESLQRDGVDALCDFGVDLEESISAYFRFNFSFFTVCVLSSSFVCILLFAFPLLTFFCWVFCFQLRKSVSLQTSL